ncbi:MAG: aryl-sulfate sulfotransferase [Ignavibacteria bacterium]
MKTTIFFILIFFLNSYLNAKVIYLEPASNAKYVNINNNIIIGLNERIENSDLNSIINVTGTLSDIHTGEIILAEDKTKIIFKPHYPFSLNEKVVVKVHNLKTSSGIDNSFTYTFQTQLSKVEWDYKKSFIDEIGNTSSENIFTESEGSSNLPILTVNLSNNPTPGDLYLSNFPFIVIPNTPYLLTSNNQGTYSFFKEVNDYRALDFKKQPNGMLTYGANGKFYAENAYHNLIDSFECGNGYETDHHELRILNNGHALLMSYDPQAIDMSKIVPGGNENATVIGLIIQELDENKNVVFQWRSWDHFAITDAEHENLTAEVVDCVHGNAIELDNDGNLLISSRHLSEITKISRSTGEIIWRLGGVHNQFIFVNDPIQFSYQHHIRRIPNGNITLFDNGNFHTPPFSRAVEYNLDETNKIATLVWKFRHVPDIHGFAMGSVQRLTNGNSLICWGAANPSMTEVSPAGNIVLEMSLPANIYTYRIFRDEANLTLNVKLAIEGFYDIQTNQLRIKDSVKAYLRNVNSPFAIIDSSDSEIDSISLTGTFQYHNASTGIYYISIKHRNGLETWSKNGGELLSKGMMYSYDFTSSISNAYGNNLVLKGTKYCLYSGDVNQDGYVNLVDKVSIYNNAVNFITGYVNTDINGDNVVNLDDLLIANNNSLKFVSARRP